MNKAGELYGPLVRVIADLVESRKYKAGSHIEHTRRILEVLINRLRKHEPYRKMIGGWDVDVLLEASALHDIGKIAVSDQILLKTDRLTVEEFNIMKQHTLFGVTIIEQIESRSAAGDFCRYAKLFAGTHHEKWNGTGYPRGLTGDEIPLEGRLMAITDVYDALVSVRPYKKSFSHEEAVKIIAEGGGIHFDPVITDLFTDAAEDFKEITKR
jgi:putative two-component system response regulator